MTPPAPFLILVIFDEVQDCPKVVKEEARAREYEDILQWLVDIGAEEQVTIIFLFYSHPGGYNHFLYFTCSLINLCNLCVTHETFKRKIS